MKDLFLNKSTLSVFGLFILIYIVLLGFRPMIIPDEARYCEIPREMIKSGDWVVPHLNGLRYFEKPVLGYQITAVSMLVFGENNFAGRFPSALAAGLSALLIFFVVRKFIIPHFIGLLAVGVFLTFLLVFGVGTFNVLDTMLSFFLTGTIATFFLAYMEERKSRKRIFLVCCGLFCGLAFLTKGFLAFVVPAAAIFPFMIWEKQVKELFKMCWIPLVIVILISLPWAIMIHMRESDYWHFFIWNEHFRRFASSDAQHSESIFFFLYILPGAALPWSFFFPATITGLKLEGTKNKLVRFSLCWFLFSFLFYSVSKGKLATYILPCFPPLAILVATGIHRYFIDGRSKSFNIGAKFLGGLFLVVTVGLIGVQVMGQDSIKPYSRIWQIVLALVVALSFAIFMFLASKETQWNKKILKVIAGSIVLMLLYPFIFPDPTIMRKAPGEFLLGHSDKIHPDSILIADDDCAGVTCWTYKRSDVYIVGGKGELGYGLGYEDSQQRALELGQVNEFIRKNRSSGLVTLILRENKFNKYEKFLEKPIYKDSNGEKGFVFAQF